MPDVASGAHELRVTGTTTAVRVFYFVKLADAILVFHAFQKKTHKTPQTGNGPRPTTTERGAAWQRLKHASW